MTKIRDDDRTVEFEDTPEMHKAVFNKLMEYYFDTGSFSGESIAQCDHAQIDASVILSDIADDIIKFKVKYDDEI